MNKNIKKIVAIVLAIGTISAVAPATNINLLTRKVYASNDKIHLDTLKFYNKDRNSIKLYDDGDYKDRIGNDDVEADEVYYANTSSKTVDIEIDGPDDRYVRVFRGTDDSAISKKVNEDINLLLNYSCVTTFIVKVYSEEPKDDIRYKDNKDYTVLSTYKVKVKYTGKDKATDEKDKTAADYDKIYLDRLSVDGKMINLSNSEINYTANVDSNVDNVTIRATPVDDKTYVNISGDDVDDDDNYKKDVDLVEGENKIKIALDNGDENRVYNLVVNRGGVSSTSTSTTKDNTTSTISTKTDTTASTTSTKTITPQWVNTNGIWQCHDVNGNLVKSAWIQNYYLQDNGNMATGWLNNGGNLYYLGNDGAKKIGWQYINGKWYYLKDDGSMAYNTTIGTYKLGADGAWY